MTSRVDREKPYICVDVDLPRNERLELVDDPAGCLGIWTALTCYAREQLTDGRVPKRYAESLWGDKKNAARLKDMCRVGLLDEDETHYGILRYAPRNQTKESVEGARKKAREYMAEKRKRSNVVSSNNELTTTGKTPDVAISISTSISSLVSKDPESHEDPVTAHEAPAATQPPTPGRPPAWRTDPDERDSLAVAWAEGARDVGLALTKPALSQRERVVDAIVAHAPPSAQVSAARGERSAWVRRMAQDWARTRPEKRAVYAWVDFVDGIYAGAQAPHGPTLERPSDSWPTEARERLERRNRERAEENERLKQESMHILAERAANDEAVRSPAREPDDIERALAGAGRRDS